jgi:tRNA(Ile)-lysidine synthase TilS/MesJ
MIKKGEVVGYNKSTDFRDVVLEDLLNMFSKKGMVEIVKMPSKKKIDKIAISSTIDSESNKIVQILVKGNAKDLKEVAPVDKKIIKPLYLFLDAEVLLYAKIKKLKFKDVKIKKDKLSMFVDELEKKHPEIKRAILNTYLELE